MIKGGKAAVKQAILILAILIICTSLASAATYYVDSKAGADTNNGLATATPIKTITKVNTLALKPGDNVLFKRGSVWRCPVDAYLKFTRGSSDNYITYSSYGNGDKPKILGSFNASNNSMWINNNNNIWEYNYAFSNEIGNIIFNDETGVGIRNWGLSEISAGGQGHYYYNITSKRLFLYSADNPADFYDTIELAEDQKIFYLYGPAGSWTGMRWVIVDDLDLRYSADVGIEIGYKSHNITIRNVDVSWIGGAIWSGKTRLGNAIQIWENASDILVENNTINEVLDAALTIQGSKASYPTNILFANNIVKNSAYCYEFFESDASSISTNHVFDHNTCYDVGDDWATRTNQRYSQTSKPKCFRMGNVRGTATGISFTNNICHVNKDYLLTTMTDFNGWQGNNNLTIDYNLYTISTTPIILWNLGGSSSYNTLAAYSSGTGKDLHSSIGSPLFTDPDNGDFTPQAGSPACNMSSTGSYVGAVPCVGEPSPPEPFCGDNTCNANENCSTCGSDCGTCPIPDPVCGDATCDLNETCSTCNADCGTCPPPAPFCGDGTCNIDESCTTCSSDCGTCSPPAPQCGDGTCNGDESCSTCSNDCGVCPAPEPFCGDSVCNGIESCSTCSSDCGSCPVPEPACGDSSCNGNETCSTCSSDCGTCPAGPFCGDSIVNNIEECDGGSKACSDQFGYAGFQDCNANCTWGACVPYEFCGDGIVNASAGEACELPGVQNSSFCPQSTSGDCLGNKSGVRDAFGYCNHVCGCLPDLVNYTCVKGQCGAGCASDADCNDGNANTADSCNSQSCGCEHKQLAYCGDGTCNNNESCSSCSSDCGTCPKPRPSNKGGGGGGGGKSSLLTSSQLTSSVSTSSASIASNESFANTSVALALAANVTNSTALNGTAVDVVKIDFGRLSNFSSPADGGGKGKKDSPALFPILALIGSSAIAGLVLSRTL